jgi:polyketide biosynthesis enoyl-CoA hydratase PksH
MKYKTLLVEHLNYIYTITFNRLINNNSINLEFLQELTQALDKAEQSAQCKVIILQGQQGIFCTGMDFIEASMSTATELSLSFQFMQLIKRLTLIPKIVIATVDGQVIAGGIGIVAASDLVIATSRSIFSLSEVLWGLLPACVTPYLIRRIGFQNAYRMTLTTLPVNAERAKEINLVDELNESPESAIQQLMVRLVRLENSTIANVKKYFRKMWIINDPMEKVAVDEMKFLLESSEVKQNIQRFVKYKQFPWDKLADQA